MHANCAVVECQIEWPTKDFLAEKFPAVSWNVHSNSVFASMFIAHTVSFEKVLAQWEENIFTAIQPNIPLPFGGLLQTIGWYAMSSSTYYLGPRADEMNCVSLQVSAAGGIEAGEASGDDRCSGLGSTGRRCCNCSVSVRRCFGGGRRRILRGG